MALPTLFASLLLTTGSARMATLRADLTTGNFAHALATLDKNTPSNPCLPSPLERGPIGHYANDFDASHTAFDLAERISDDLYTRSLSREAAALLTADNARSAFRDEGGHPVETRTPSRVPIRARRKTFLNDRTFE